MNFELTEVTESQGERCAGCERPATRYASLSLDVHWVSTTLDDGDGDSLVDIHDWMMCDECDPAEELFCRFLKTGIGLARIRFTDLPYQFVAIDDGGERWRGNSLANLPDGRWRVFLDNGENLLLDNDGSGIKAAEPVDSPEKVELFEYLNEERDF